MFGYVFKECFVLGDEVLGKEFKKQVMFVCISRCKLRGDKF